LWGLAARSGSKSCSHGSDWVYWRPIWNLLEGQFELLLANAAHVKNVPGRKTDVKDSEWIAQLMQHGLLKASFVPDTVLRDLRELSRDRTSLVAERSRLKNRIQKILEDANIKLGSVASDIWERVVEPCLLPW
jgi:transposase